VSGDWEPGPALDDEADEPEDEEEAGPAGDADKPAPKPVYPDLDSWVRQHLAQVYSRRFGGALTWCAQWYRHPEAVSRLNAMWSEWEKAVAESTLSSWWLYHADPHMNVLMSRDSGPFVACKPEKHVEMEKLPVGDSDPNLWHAEAFSDHAPDPAAGPSSASASSESAD
jgi:hypothetical protein